VNLQTALLQGTQLLEQGNVAAPRLTAEVLLAHAIGCERSWLYAHSTDELRELWWIHYGRYLHQRMDGLPTQYVTGCQEFFGREFRVTRDVLIPRPETELVLETALARLRNTAGNRPTALEVRIADIGTGSGAIAVTLALEMAQCEDDQKRAQAAGVSLDASRLIATDISLPALQVAEANARKLGAKVQFLCCDLGSALSSGIFDLVVSNPPYVPESDRVTLQAEVRDYEPAQALYGGVDGLAVYRRLVPEAARLLKSGGILVMEIGYLGGDSLRQMLSDPAGVWQEIEILTDLAGLERVVTARRG